MQVMYLGHAIDLGHRPPDLRRVTAGGGALQKDPAGRADQADTGVRHQCRDHQGGHRVGTRPARRYDDEAGDRGGQKGPQIIHQVRHRAPDVQAARIGPAREQHGEPVDADTDQCHHEHCAAVDVRRGDQAADGGDGEPARQ